MKVQFTDPLASNCILLMQAGLKTMSGDQFDSGMNAYSAIRGLFDAAKAVETADAEQAKAERPKPTLVEPAAESA